MASSTLSKSGGVVLLAHTQHASNSITVGSAVDVATAMAARIIVSLGRVNATALSYPVLFRFQASAENSGDDSWIDVYQFSSSSKSTSTGAAWTLNATASAGAATFTLSSDAPALGSDWYIRETGTPANSEWGTVKGRSSGTVTPANNLTRGHASGVTFTTSPEHVSWTESLVGIKRVRLIVDSASLGAAGQTVDVFARMVVLDSVQTA